MMKNKIKTLEDIDKKSISSIIVVILIVLITVILISMILTWSKDSVKTKLDDATENMKVLSELECNSAKYEIEFCNFDINKNIELLITNNSRVDFSYFTLSVFGKNISGESMMVTGLFNTVVNSGSSKLLSTNLDYYSIVKQDSNLSLLDLNQEYTFSLVSASCPNNVVDLTCTYTAEYSSLPIFSIPAGNYSSTQDVIISTDSDAVIYYTLDGSTPSTNSSVYSSPITLLEDTTTTIKAIALKSGYLESPVSTGTYVITHTLTTPTFSPVAGAIIFGTTVTISSEAGTTIYYTINGDTPTTSSTNQAVTPLVINSAITVKALAVKEGYANSDIGNAIYTSAGIPVSIPAILGVTVPIVGATPITTITSTAQYTGTVTWAPVTSTFNATTVYTATISLTSLENYTFTGVTANFFTVTGATIVTNVINSGIVTATFPETMVPYTCLANMAYIPKLGAQGYCIDKYEASNGGGGVAVSQAGVAPWGGLNLASSQTACTNAGKYLCTSAQWLGAADINGMYYDLPENLGNAPYNCVVNGPNTALTGSRSNCKSKYDVYDMVGNFDERVNEGVSTGVNPCQPPGYSGNCFPSTDGSWKSTSGVTTSMYGNDGVYFPAYVSTNRTVLRGGRYWDGSTAGPFSVMVFHSTTIVDTAMGFRCCSGPNMGSGITSISTISDAYVGFTTVN